MWTAKILSYTVSIDQREKMHLRIMSLKRLLRCQTELILQRSYKSRVIKNLKRGSVLVLEGDRILEEKAKQDDGRFVVKLDLRRRLRFLFFTWLQPSRFVAWWRRPWFSDVTTLQRRLANHRSVTWPALLPKERNVEVSMELDEREPEEQAKQVSSGDTEEQNKNWMNYVGCSIVRHYLPFGKTCLTFVIFFIKILKAKKVKQHFSMRSISLFW